MIDWVDSLGSPGMGLLAAAGLVAAAFGLGLPILRRAHPRLPRHPFDEAVVAVVLGLDALALLALAVGVVRIPSRALLAMALAAPCALGVALAARALRSRSLRARLARPWPWVVVAAAMLPVLGGALCWPVGWDELTYHVEVPARWLAMGRVAVLRDLPYSAFPSAGELLFTLAVRLGGVTAPRALCVVLWALCGAAAYRLARPGCGRGAATAVAFAFAWMPSFLMVASETYVEGLLVLHVAALVLVARAGEWTTRRAVLAGALGGAAAAVKLVAVLVAPVAAAAVARRAPRIRTALAAAGVAACVAAPFYARALLATGNPVHPFYAEVFERNDPAALATSAYHHDIASRRYGVKGAASIVKAPVLLTTEGDLFSGRLGWQWPPLLLLGLAGMARPRGRRLLLGAGVAFLAWLVTAQQSRFLLPAVLLVAISAAGALRSLRSRYRCAAIAVLIAGTLASSGRDRWMLFWSTWQAGAHVGQAPRVVDWLHTGTGDAHLLAMAAVADLTPRDARVLLLFDPRGLYVPRAHEVGTPLFQPRWFTPPEGLTPGEVLRVLREGAFTHVLIGAPKRNPDLLPDHVARCQPLLDSLARLEADGSLVALWEAQGFRLLDVSRNGSPHARLPKHD